MKHLDLFSGIGGFAYAADTVFGKMEHVFCDFDPFCQQVLKKHWPESEVYSDIRSITTDPFDKRLERGSKETEGRSRQPHRERSHEAPFLLTGGFPCQPFSAAGLRRGTADDRHLWPEMLRVIQLTKPTWVIAENVRGLVTWNEGMVLEQVCTDLEAEGYEVQPFIIPAVAVNAPHRRDRVWFIANRSSDGRTWRGSEAEAEEGRTTQSQPDGQLQSRSQGQDSNAADTTSKGSQGELHRQREDEKRRSESTLGRGRSKDNDAAHAGRQRRQPGSDEGIRSESEESIGQDSGFSSWQRNWHEVAAEFCSVDDGLPVELDGFELSKPQHRKEQLKAYGNAIVPQVAIEIMRAIKSA